MPSIHVLILTEQRPPKPGQPASGLSLRHQAMACAWSAGGARVTLAWPKKPAEPGGVKIPGVEWLALDSPDELGLYLGRERVDVVVLGYWELAPWLPGRIKGALVLDYIAPRLLERQFEDRDRLSEDAASLLPLLARCNQVWVGNRRQLDLMIGWMLLAGHDCRLRTPLRIVPIAGTPVDRVKSAHDSPLVLFHGGRDWPWRDSRRWLKMIAESDGDWKLLDASEQGHFGSQAEYRQRLANADLLLELSDENVERRYSQSFRMTDALCAGLSVLCNRFLPLAAEIERRQAGWTVDSPGQLPGLLAEIAADRAELRRRSANALELARQLFDADRIYGGMLDGLRDVAKQPRIQPEPRHPLLSAGGGATASARPVVRDMFSRWLHHRLRSPMHRFMSRILRDRPRPTGQKSAWVVVSRSDLFPTHHGAAVKIERTAWGLSFQLDEVLLLTDRRDGYWRYCRGQREFHRFPWWMRLPGWSRRINVARLMRRGVPQSEALLYLPLVDRGLHLRLMWLLGRHPVAVVQGEFPACAHPAVWAARLFGTSALMVEHNVEYQRIADQVPELTEAERLKLKRVEVDLANACDRVITVSEQDREMLIQAGVQPGRVRTIPHGVDLERFERARPIDLRRRFDIPAEHAVLVYHGIYSYPPNLEAVEELSGHLLPALAEAGHPATVVAIGPQPPDRSLEGVVFSGAVDDLAGHLKGADLAVIALRSGGGTRMKILDDFAAGVPVISTSKGMEGIPVEHERELLVVDDPEDMVQVVIGLLEDPARAETIAGNARQWVQAFDWREIARRYVELMRQ